MCPSVVTEHQCHEKKLIKETHIAAAGLGRVHARASIMTLQRESENASTVEPPSKQTLSSAALTIGAVAGVGIGIALVTPSVRRSRQRSRGQERHDALRRYLIDHLSGSDTAYRLVDRLRHAYHGTPHGRLFESLFRDFSEERQEVMALLQRLGSSSNSLKRLTGKIAGVASQAVSVASPGSLSYFATLEGLAIAVQGKRCLWRAAQQLEPAIYAVGSRSFADLEDLAIAQWERIERRRLSLIGSTFEVWRNDR